MKKSYKELPSQAKLNALYNYDPVSGLLSYKDGSTVGWIATDRYRYTKIRGERYLTHRIIWVMMYGMIPAAAMIDHVDGDRSNNKLNNLRLATGGQNQCNRTADSGRQFKGVYKARDKWKAEITSFGVRHYLGVFDCPESAGRAYAEAAERLHGAFARY